VSRRTTPKNVKPARFTARDIAGTVAVYDGDKHFVTVATMSGAEHLASILNDTALLADIAHVIAADPDFGRQKILYALRKLLNPREVE
jgi:hypothetical protein